MPLELKDVMPISWPCRVCKDLKVLQLTPQNPIPGIAVLKVPCPCCVEVKPGAPGISATFAELQGFAQDIRDGAANLSPVDAEIVALQAEVLALNTPIRPLVPDEFAAAWLAWQREAREGKW